MRVFLDANVLWSASHHDGAVRALLAALRARGHMLVADAYVTEEARRNLGAGGQVALAELLLGCEMVPAWTPLSGGDAHGLPPKDLPVLRCAIAAGCEGLLTGDRRHFGRLMGHRIEGVLVLATGDAARLLDD